LSVTQGLDAMGYTIDMTVEGPVLRVLVKGTVDDRSSTSFSDHGRQLVATCMAGKCRGILLDVRSVPMELGRSARVQGFMALADAVPAGVRVAVLGATQPTGADGPGRLLAASRGLMYRLFDSDADAVAWLSAGGPASGPS
jgi:hypothetical protein